MDQRSNRLTNPVVLCLLALFCCALWGSAFPFIKIGYRLFAIPSDAPGAQILFAGIRFAFAGVLVILIGSITEKRVLIPKLDAMPKVLLLSLFQTVLQYVFFYVGLAHTTGVKASIINGAGVFMSILAAVLFRMEKLNAQKVAGCLLGFAGVVLVNLMQGSVDFSFSPVGEGFILISAASSALSSVAIKRFSQTLDPVMLSGWQFLCGGAVMMVIGLLLGGTLTTVTFSGIMVLCWLAFVSAAAYSVWSLLLKYNPVSKVAVFGFANPVFGVILSALLLAEGQSFGWMTLCALLLVSAGIATVYMKRKEEA